MSFPDPHSDCAAAVRRRRYQHDAARGCGPLPGMVFSLVTLVLGVYAFIVGVNGANLRKRSLDPRCRSLVCARW